MLRSASTLVLFAGVSSIAAAGTAFIATSLAPELRPVAFAILAISVVLVGGGATALYLSRPKSDEQSGPEPSRPVGAQSLVVAAALVVLPLWLTLRFLPLLAEARFVIEITPWNEMFKGANANGSALVLIPLAIAAAPPILELAALVACAATSLVMLARLMARSPQAPRVLLACVALIGTLVIASVVGGRASADAATAARALIDSTSPTASERAQLIDGVDRYERAVTSGVVPLLWTLAGYAACVPLLMSRRPRF